VAFSQTNNLRRAKTSYTKFSDTKLIGNPQLGLSDLNSAHQNLLKAIEHDRTKDLAETWVYYALVTSDLALLKDAEEAKTLISTALDARDKAKELDSDNAQAENFDVLGLNLAQYEMNMGVLAWDAQDFDEAYNRFSRAETFVPGDTTLIYYAGAAAIQGQNYSSALEKYLQLVDVDEYSNHSQVMLDIPRIFMMEGDTVTAVKYANIGMEKYPENNDFATQYIEYNLIAGNEAQVVGSIKALSEKDPDNKVLYYYLGLAYSAMDDEVGAEEAYRKSLSIDSNYEDANINLGGLILNQGIDQWNLVNSQRDITQEEYDAGLAKALEIFELAYPYLQKAVALNDQNLISLYNLQKYYQLKEDQEKTDELQAKIDALQ
ncbi:MAG TPA: hypothetical protein VKZ78_03150, partial [Sphingobacteriaceae bacterium]|nr:hypothetical protein [Sphingobacteriaceae bacterium]